MSCWRYAWLPSVITSAPARVSSSTARALIPIPPDAFSPLTITRSGCRSARSTGSVRCERPAPAEPTTSPIASTVSAFVGVASCASGHPIHPAARPSFAPRPVLSRLQRVATDLDLAAVRAVLADLDGTLIDSTPATLRVYAGWMDERGIERPDRTRTACLQAGGADARAPPRRRRRGPRDRASRGGDTDGVRALPGAEALLLRVRPGALRSRSSRPVRPRLPMPASRRPDSSHRRSW